MNKQKVYKLLKREFLRGYITATKSKYTYESLCSVYRKYRKDNPKLKTDISKTIKEL